MALLLQLLNSCLQGFLLFGLGRSITQIAVAYRNIGIDGFGFYLVVGFDSLGEAVQIARSRDGEAGSVTDISTANDAKGVPVEGSYGVVAGETDNVAAIGRTQHRDDQVGAGGSPQKLRVCPKSSGGTPVSAEMWSETLIKPPIPAVLLMTNLPAS